jgi:hypothetical protein
MTSAPFAREIGPEANSSALNYIGVFALVALGFYLGWVLMH